MHDATSTPAAILVATAISAGQTQFERQLAKKAEERPSLKGLRRPMYSSAQCGGFAMELF
jgi:hypothetical protein